MSEVSRQPPPVPSQPAPPPTIGYQTPQAQPPMSGRQTYNVVADTVTGVNFRLRDNLIQLICSIAFAAIGAGILFFIAEPGDAPTMAAVGAIGGLIAGIILSGAFLAIYRAVRHMAGRHD